MLSWTRLHVWCRALDGTNPSRRCYRSCTGFQFDVEWISRWPPWSACHCPAWLQPIWPPTAIWSPTKVVVSCVLPHQGRASWDEHTATMETGVLQLQARSCGTLRQADINFQRFRWLLKTFLFMCWNRCALLWLLKLRLSATDIGVKSGISLGVLSYILNIVHMPVTVSNGSRLCQPSKWDD